MLFIDSNRSTEQHAGHRAPLSGRPGTAGFSMRSMHPRGTQMRLVASAEGHRVLPPADPDSPNSQKSEMKLAPPRGEGSALVMTWDVRIPLTTISS